MNQCSLYVMDHMFAYVRLQKEYDLKKIRTELFFLKWNYLRENFLNLAAVEGHNYDSSRRTI